MNSAIGRDEIEQARSPERLKPFAVARHKIVKTITEVARPELVPRSIAVLMRFSIFRAAE
jgi:hypothetical protein